MAVLEIVAQPGEGPPLHTHGREDETMYVLEGDFRFKLDGALRTTQPGSFVFIPRGVAHTWQNIGERPARMLVTFAPAGMEAFFEGLAEIEFDLDEFRRVAAECAMEVVGPALAESDPL
jgi:quercetin dioxygenase-like cupin family protein